jgi:hypothetical protein
LPTPSLGPGRGPLINSSPSLQKVPSKGFQVRG